jgi:hypothetical protein
MAAHISPRPTPVASQLLTPQKNVATHSEPQKNTFRSELSDANNRAQESGKNAASAQKTQETVEKSNNDSFAKSEDISADNINNSSISASDTNVIRDEQQQKQANENFKNAELAQTDVTNLENPVSSSRLDKGQDLPDTGGKLPPPIPNTPLNTASISQNNILPTINAELVITAAITQNNSIEVAAEQSRVSSEQAVSASKASTVTPLPSVSSVVNSEVATNVGLETTEKIVVSSTAISEAEKVASLVQPAASNSIKAVASPAIVTNDDSLGSVTAVAPLAKGAKQDLTIAQDNINQRLVDNGQVSDLKGTVEKTVISSEISASNTASNQNAIQGSLVAQATLSQDAINAPIDNSKQTTQSQLNAGTLVSTESVKNNIIEGAGNTEKNQLINQNVNSVTAAGEKLATDNAAITARESAITAPPQTVSQVATVDKDRVSLAQASSSDIKLTSEKMPILGSSEPTLLNDTSKKTIINDTRLQGSQPLTPMSTLPVNPTSLTDNQTLALNQSLEKMRSGIDVGTLSNQTDDAATVKNSVDKALVANEAVQQLSHLQNNLKTASPVQLQMPVATPPTAKNWGNAVADKVMIAASQNLRVANIQLDPPELGALQVRLQVTGPDQQMSVSFTSPHASVRDALEQNLPRLREMLEEQGINLGESSVNDQGKGDSNGGASGQNSSLYADQDEGATINPLNTQGSLALVDFYA